MSDDGKGILGNLDATGAEIRDALEHAVQNALREHKRAGNSVVVWDRDKDHIVILRADQIELTDESPAALEPVERT
jgi:hypothetical protein